ncbi:MAG: lipid A deacylase LpxR family protein [Gammaproteobacteria bacterium]|nr:MAG: lipid A deacylase LpxR family protein [Gammaproteobacteria bacterium]
MATIKKILIAIIFLPFSSYADQLSFLLYNDYFAGTDRYFTNGVAFIWLNEQKRPDDSDTWTIDYVENNPFYKLKKNKSYTFGISFTHIMITPADVLKQTTQYDDIPYAAHAGLSFNLYQWDKTSFKEFRVELGSFGPRAYGEEAQNNWHDFINKERSEGWDTQLENQGTINSTLRYGKISYQGEISNYLKSDWFNQAGLELGNFETDFFISSIYRIGNNYPLNFNVHYPYLKEEASLLKIQKNPPSFGWSLNTGINAKLIHYSYVTDEAKQQNYNITKRVAQGSLYFGLDLFYQNHKLISFYQYQSPYIKESSDTHTLGGFMYSYNFK